MYYIGIDVGGTNIKFGLMEDTEILKSITMSTNAFDIVRQIVNGTRELVRSVGKELRDIVGVGVGFPGVVVNSVVLDSPNIGLENVDLQDILYKELGIPVIVKNDAEMATLAEHRYGIGEMCNNMVMLTIGTGVGGGIIINREIYSGNGGAGEFGHIIMNKKAGIKCNCGRTGCVEQYISLTALDRISKEMIASFPDTSLTLGENNMMHASELIKGYKRNDACAVAIVSKYVDDLSSFILDVCNVFRPDKVVVGGGLSYTPEIIEMCARKCKEQNFGFKNSPRVEIVPAKLGNYAGMLGAVVCLDRSEETIEKYENYRADENVESLDNVYIPQEEPVVENAPIANSFVDDLTAQQEELVQQPEVRNANVSELSSTVGFLQAAVKASLDGDSAQGGEGEYNYDDPDLLNRINNILKQKD